MTARSFRHLAIAMEGAVEGAHMDHPDFRVNGRIFATLKHDLKTGMVVLTPEHHQRFVHERPDAFEPESGAWGRQGCTRVHLSAVDDETLGEAMTLAWQNIVRKGPPRRTSAARAKKKRPPA